MFGKHFASMYTGSMRGAGAINFAVMGYVIAHAKPQGDDEMHVELNSEIVAFLIGEPKELVEGAITFLSSPDPKSRSKEEEGRRLVKLGEFLYKLVNGPKYRAMRDQEHRREQLRVAQQKFRDKTNNVTAPALPNVTKRYTPPSMEEVKLLCAKAGLPDIEAEKFFNYYTSNGWKVGKNRMVSPPHAVGNWAANWRQNGSNTNTNHRHPYGQSPSEEGEFDKNLKRMLSKIKPDEP